ncbi:MAG: hypothetical protein JST35_03600 [Armatimonadetes bacterium]|nr:hypothetical protein [Armatimonadota bacterium]
MAQKPFYKNPVYVAGMLIGGVALFLLTQPQEEVKTRPSTKKLARKADKNSIFIDQDYTAKFESVATPVRNTFKPLLTKDAGKNSVDEGKPNGIPQGLAEGEANWIYTGLATIDGKAQALVENPTTGDSEFLVRGQKWKSCTVVDMSSESLVLRSQDGETVTISINGAEKAPTTQPVQRAELPPTDQRQNLRGRIGRQNDPNSSTVMEAPGEMP